MKKKFIITLNEQKSFSRTYEPFEGEEFGYVLKGKVELHLVLKHHLRI